MFEVEASEKANKKYPIPKVCNELDVARNRKYEEGFKDGAEFVYRGPLTKAKKIIKELMSFSVQLCDCRHTVDFEKTREEAEQFLKEVE